MVKLWLSVKLYGYFEDVATFGRCLRAVNCWSSSVWVERLMAAASVDRGEEFFGTVDQLAVAEVMPAAWFYDKVIYQ